MTEIKPSPEHRPALEARLLARYDQLHPEPKEKPMQTFARRHATQLVFAAVLAVALGAAAQAPAQLVKQVGTRVEIETAASIDPAELRKALESLQEQPEGGFGGSQQERRAREILVRRIHTPDGSRLQVDLFGDPLRADAEQRLRAALPQLRDAAVRISAIDATVETSVAGKLAFDLLGREPSGLSAEELKRTVQERLRAAGETGDVDVKVDDEGGKRRVEVRVRKDQTR
jgi:hypothetical protein